jgi:hypothetical protein
MSNAKSRFDVLRQSQERNVWGGLKREQIGQTDTQQRCDGSATDSRRTATSCRRHHPEPLFTVRGICETGPDVFRVQVRKIGQDFLNRHSRGQVFQHVLHSQAQPPNAGLSAPFVGFNRNPIRVVHDFTLHRCFTPVNERERIRKTVIASASPRR